MEGQPGGCRPEVGSGAASRRKQSNTARIPDVMIRCGNLPRVVFEVVAPSELRHWHARDRKRKDLQEIDSVAEILEISQSDSALHVYRREPTGAWSFEALGDAGTTRCAASGLKSSWRRFTGSSRSTAGRRTTPP